MTARPWPDRAGLLAPTTATPELSRRTSLRPLDREGIGRAPARALALVPQALRVIVPATLISGLIVVGIAVGSGAMQAVGAGLALLASVVAPEVGLGVLLVLAPLQPPPAVPAPGLNFLLVGALLVGCLWRLPIDRPRLRLNPSALFLLGYLVYVSAQQLPDMLAGYRGDEGHTIGYLFFQVLTGFGLVLVAGYVLRGRSPLPVLTMALLGAAVAATVTAATFENQGAGSPFGGLVAVADAGLRAAGPFVNPNYMGTFAAAILVGIVAMWNAVGSRIGKALLVGLAILCVIAIVEAQSRGAIVAGFAAIAAVVWLRNRRLAVAIVGLGIVGAVLVYPAFVQWRLTNELGDASDAGYVAMTESDDARLNASLAGPAMFAAEPIFGVGFGQFVEKSVEISGLDTGINAHNWYVNVLAEQGTTGGLLWLGAIVATIAELRTRRGVAQVVGIGMFTMIAVGSNFLELPESFQLAAIPAVILIAALVADWPDRSPTTAGANPIAATEGGQV